MYALYFTYLGRRLHVRARLHGGVSALLGDRGRVRRLRRSPGQPRRHAFGGFAGASREAAGVQAAVGWTFPWASSLGSDFNFDFYVWFSEEQQREGSIEYNYRRGGHAMDATSVPEPVAELAATVGTDAATYTRERPGMSEDLRKRRRRLGEQAGSARDALPIGDSSGQGGFPVMSHCLHRS